MAYFPLSDRERMRLDQQRALAPSAPAAPGTGGASPGPAAAGAPAPAPNRDPGSGFPALLGFLNQNRNQGAMMGNRIGSSLYADRTAAGTDAGRLEAVRQRENALQTPGGVQGELVRQFKSPNYTGGQQRLDSALVRRGGSYFPGAPPPTPAGPGTPHENPRTEGEPRPPPIAQPPAPQAPFPAPAPPQRPWEPEFPDDGNKWGETDEEKERRKFPQLYEWMG